MLLWGGWGVLSKPLSSALSPWQVQSLSCLGVLPVLAFLARSPNLRSGSNPRKGFVIACGSGVLGSLGNVAYYESLAAGGKAAAVTPITVRQFISPSKRMCLPIASCLGQKRRAVSAFTIATGGLPDISAVEKERPDSMGTFIT